MASSAASAPSTGFRLLQIAGGWRFAERNERWLEAERGQIVLWIPVMLGVGIAAWFALPDANRWGAVVLGGLAVAAAGLALGGGGRAARCLAVAGLLVAIGCALVWWRAERLAAPVLARPAIVAVQGKVERVEKLPARDMVRLRIAPDAGAGLPPMVRVNLDSKDVPAGLTRGAVVKLRARLMPPAPPAIPGAYDFERVAWFDRLGASGRGFAPVEIVTPGEARSGLRERLTAHVQSQIEGSAGGIAAALVTGDRGAISEADGEALGRSGLAHLLSVSGLHVTAVVGATMLLVLRLLALSPALALRWPLPVIAAGAAGVAAVGYTLLTGAEVPTMRSCIAALMVLAAMMLGREAITLRLVAFGALVVLLLWPEALMGPSFQMSFAAVTAIVALHESRRVRGWFERREEGWGWRLVRGVGSLLLTGLVVEIALTPIALFHFHKSGVYGALANIIAIPLTTFVIMPLAAVALFFDLAGLGAPFWWLAGKALGLLLWIAHAAAGAPGALAMLPGMPGGAYALMAAGGLWFALWKTRMRLAGLVPAMAGAVWALATPMPDLLVTGDGRHLALRLPNGEVAILRDRAGDYVRDMMAENGGVDAELPALADQRDARCSPDLCLIDVEREGRRWRIAATRSGYLVPWREMIAVCRSVDIVVSDRRLPPGCAPKWLKLDRALLAKTGGVAITLGERPSVRTVRQAGARHPWIEAERKMPARSAGT
ncbi:ComEC/Rec2 family competence protein [Sphingomonas koreensis]|uniref:ComEC/Rec2 family competence protein n=1 Tax=Sphingomonas koreensis TaxID=93064 RepID=UPI00082D3A53|nr:ComEC/Rec2 family competence protein [Sphingomonas koreensis]RSU58284.1 ComEC/Rec2 family competence protein [Sphingomonas koreensis]RSU71762.1 ComEC/Rec2 family competence protein [Sphingomonas koreensis]